MSKRHIISTSKHKPETKCPENISEAGFTCACLNARSVVNKKNEVNSMVDDIGPRVIGVTESLASNDSRC